MSGHDKPTWGGVNPTRAQWLADVAAKGGPVKGDRMLFTSQERGALQLLADFADSRLLSANSIYRASITQALETVWQLLDSPAPRSVTFWLGAEGEAP